MNSESVMNATVERGASRKWLQGGFEVVCDGGWYGWVLKNGGVEVDKRVIEAAREELEGLCVACDAKPCLASVDGYMDHLEGHSR